MGFAEQNDCRFAMEGSHHRRVELGPTCPIPSATSYDAAMGSEGCRHPVVTATSSAVPRPRAETARAVPHVVLIGVADMESFVAVGVALAYAQYGDEMAPRPTLALIGGAGVVAVLATVALFLLPICRPGRAEP